MPQQIIGDLLTADIEANWTCRGLMLLRDMAALNPLPHSHFNPYGVFDLDMDTRLPLEEMKMAA